MISRVSLAVLLAFLLASQCFVATGRAQNRELRDLIGQVAKLYRTGEYDRATELANRALAMSERDLGPDHWTVGLLLSNLGLLKASLGRYAEAESLYKRALRIREKAFGLEHEQVGTTLHNLAGLYKAQGRYAEAETLYQRALKIVSHARGRNHPNVAYIINGLAELHLAQGHFAKAKPFFQRALKLREKALGPSHPHVAITLHSLASLYSAQGHYAEAAPIFLRALKMREAALGKQHPDVAQSLNSLAGTYQALGRHSEAELLYLLTKSIAESALGPEHPHVATILNNLALVYQSQGRFAEAEKLFKRSLTIRETAFGSDNPGLTTALKNLAALYQKLGRKHEARGLQKRLAGMPPKGTRHVSLFFATNRARTGKKHFGGSIADKLAFGRAVMQVPAAEVVNRAKRIGASLGQLEKAKTGKLTEAELLKLVRLQRFGSARVFAGSGIASQRRAAIFKNQVLVFVHGYNNTFEGAMQRATQLSFDLQFDGILMPFTWPSQGTVHGYLTDDRMAMKSVDVLAAFLDSLRWEMPKLKIHLIAHSMGNQVMLRALCNLAKRQRKRGVRPHNFGQVIAAHADVSKDDFEALTKCVQPAVEGITLYVNEKDTALRLRCGGFRCRAGNFARGYSVVDVIDTTSMAQGFWRSVAKGFDHDVFVRNPLLFADITRLLLTGRRPVHDRTHEFRPIKGRQARAYWAYDKSFDPAAQNAVASAQ